MLSLFTTTATPHMSPIYYSNLHFTNIHYTRSKNNPPLFIHSPPHHLTSVIEERLPLIFTQAHCVINEGRIRRHNGSGMLGSESAPCFFLSTLSSFFLPVHSSHRIALVLNNKYINILSPQIIIINILLLLLLLSNHIRQHSKVLYRWETGNSHPGWNHGIRGIDYPMRRRTQEASIVKG